MITEPTRRLFVARFLGIALSGHVVWEIAQLPLYTLWETEPPVVAVLAALHCTLGDLVIALCTLALAVIFVGGVHWPKRYRVQVATATILLGIAYTVFSEWLNTEVRGAWAYRTIMPLVPPFGTGLSPLLQWLVVPAFALWWAPRGSHSRATPISSAQPIQSPRDADTR